MNQLQTSDGVLIPPLDAETVLSVDGQLQTLRVVRIEDRDYRLLGNLGQDGDDQQTLLLKEAQAMPVFDLGKIERCKELRDAPGQRA